MFTVSYSTGYTDVEYVLHCHCSRVTLLLCLCHTIYPLVLNGYCELDTLIFCTFDAFKFKLLNHYVTQIVIFYGNFITRLRKFNLMENTNYNTCRREQNLQNT